MQNEENQLKDLENLTNEELEARVAEAEAEDTPADDDSKSTDWETKAKQAENRAAMLQRLLNKKDKTIIKTNKSDPTSISRDIEEIKLMRKIDTFAEDNNLTKSQAKKVFEINPNATAETLKDPFIAEGLKAIARKEKVEQATPGAGRSSTVGGKTFKEMTLEEREANFSKFIGN